MSASGMVIVSYKSAHGVVGGRGQAADAQHGVLDVVVVRIITFFHIFCFPRKIFYTIIGLMGITGTLTESLLCIADNPKKTINDLKRINARRSSPQPQGGPISASSCGEMP